VLRKKPYQQHPRRYDYLLTAKGIDLRPVMLAMLAWGDRYLSDGAPPMLLRHDDCGAQFTPVVHCSACGAPAPPGRVSVEPGPAAEVTALP